MHAGMKYLPDFGPCLRQAPVLMAANLALRNSNKIWSSVRSHVFCRQTFRPVTKRSVVTFTKEDVESIKEIRLNSVSLRFGCPPGGISLSDIKMRVKKVILFRIIFVFKLKNRPKMCRGSSVVVPHDSCITTTSNNKRLGR